MGTDEYKFGLELTVNKRTGKLIDVNPYNEGTKVVLSKKYELPPEAENPIPLAACTHQMGRLYSFILEWGSPGSVTIETESGPIQLTWPQG